MKKFEANIKPFELESVKQALSEASVHGMTVSEVRFYTSGDNIRFGPYDDSGVPFIPMIKVEVVVPDDMVDDVMRAMIEGADSLRKGMAAIFIRTVSEAVHIRTGQRSPEMSSVVLS